MRVLHINNHGKLLGGSEAVMLGEVEALRRANVDTFMITTGKKTLRKYRHLVVREPYLKYSIFNLRIFIEVIVWLYRKNIDIGHVHIYYGKLSNSVLCALKVYGILIVQSVHEYRRLCPNYKFLDNDGKICEQCPSNNALRSVKNKCINGSKLASFAVMIEVFIRDWLFNPKNIIDHFIYVSDFIRQKHVQYQGEDSSNILWNFTRGEIISDTGNTKDFDFVYVGRLSKEKGLLEFLGLLDGTERVAIVGEGELSEEIVSKYGSWSNITIFGFVDNGKIKALMQRAKYLVIPSLWYENNPVIVMEAYSVGVPVIGSRVGGIPEIVVDSETGYLVNFSRKELARSQLSSALVISQEEYNRLSANATRFYEAHFTVETHVTKLIFIYEKLLKRVNV
jgi:glycosyltransferase involved in cell wall biosynthesis